MDNLTLDSLLLVTRAIYSPRTQKAALLRELNLLLEQLRVLWRLVEQRRWISRQQLLFINGRMDEIGRMTGAGSTACPGKKSRRDFRGRPPEGGPLPATAAAASFPRLLRGVGRAVR